jgi:hypothetical protein
VQSGAIEFIEREIILSNVFSLQNLEGGLNSRLRDLIDRILGRGLVAETQNGFTEKVDQ